MKKFITLLTAMLLSVVAMISFTKPVLADDDTPVVTLGTSLTDSQKQGTLKTLTAPLNGGNYQTITVTGSDLVKYLNPSGDNFTTSSGVWSSAMIQKTSSGSGINVKILDYDGKNNITTITANQYKNAALTAGISDANIYVTSAIPIDGSGALAGVYAAYAKNGNALNQKQVNAAQDEMNTLSGITQDNKNKKGYSDAQLNNAVAGAKNEMAKQGQNITDSQIRDIVNNQKNQIVNLLIEIRDSGALKDGNFKQQASKLSSQIQNGAKNIFNKFNTQENRNWLQNLWDQIVKFFSGLFGGVILN